MDMLGTSTRSPEAHRAHVANTRPNWPDDDGCYWHPFTANDEKPTKRRPSNAPRHRAIAKDFTGLVAWFDVSTGAAVTAWLVADNDNSAGTERGTDGTHRINPPDDIVEAAKGVTCEWPMATVVKRQSDEHVVQQVGETLRYAGGEASWVAPQAASRVEAT